MHNINEKFSTTKNLSSEEAYLLKGTQDRLDTKEFQEKNIHSKPLVTIVTVVYNAQEYIEETILSVINQIYKNIEYIIIDGGSTDGTLDIIKKYEDKIHYVISEPDQGIYDAMNKGITIATGEWINFMNAGDTYYKSNTLEQIFADSNFEDISIIYGDNEVRYSHKNRIARAGNMDHLWQGSQFCHQSAFILTSLHKQEKYNIMNRIGADFEFFYKTSKKQLRKKYIDLVISSVSAGGLSDLKRIDSIVGRWNVVEKNTKTNLYYITIILKEMMKEKLKEKLKEWNLY